MPDRWLVDEVIVVVRPDGRRAPGRVRIGFPEQLGPPPEIDDNCESVCWAHIDELLDMRGPVHGTSTLRALVSAFDLIAKRIAQFRSTGGMILSEDGEDLSVEYAFGPLSDATP
jgi:hypothetical protein